MPKVKTKARVDVREWKVLPAAISVLELLLLSSWSTIKKKRRKEEGQRNACHAHDEDQSDSCYLDKYTAITSYFVAFQVMTAIASSINRAPNNTSWNYGRYWYFIHSHRRTSRLKFFSVCSIFHYKNGGTKSSKTTELVHLLAHSLQLDFLGLLIPGIVLNIPVLIGGFFGFTYPIC